MKAFSTRNVPLVFALVTVLAYGLLLPLTGFYWDDWPFAWLARFMGSANFLPAFHGFRPFLGPIFFITTSLIPADPRLWQVMALLVRFLSAMSAWFSLRAIWPAHPRQVLVVTLLFLVFPGYSQHWVALTHVNQEWIPFILYLLSFGFSARALRARPVGSRFAFNTFVALLLLVAGLFPTEYFIGLEPLRFFFIWVIVSESIQRRGSRLVESLKHWWPYALIWLANAVWLVSFYRSGAYVSYDLAAVQAAPGLLSSLLAFLDAAWKAGFFVWVQVLVLGAQALSAPTTLLTFALIVVACVLAVLYLRKLDLPFASGSFGPSVLLIGLLGILLGRVPSFAAGLPLTLQSSYDRFMISMMLGASLFVVGLVELLVRNARWRTFVFALLLGLGIGQQFFNANIFRRDWARQQQIYWQLAWRIPALQPGTALVTQQMPLDYETDLSMTAAVNWIYASQLRPASLPYALIYSEKRLGGIALPSLEPGTAMRLPFRTLEFTGSTSQVVVIYVPPNGCLRVLDPKLGDSETYSKFPDSLTGPIPLSDPSLIRLQGLEPSLPSPPFSRDPSHDWCFYYEKAELARQAQDWGEVVRLGNEASRQQLAPEDMFEWLPFIEGYARAGDLRAAQEITRSSWENEPKLHRGLCILWKRVRANGSSDAQHAAIRIMGQFDCGQ